MEFQKFKFDAAIDTKTFETLNSEFVKAKCLVMYTGDNRNGSSINKEAVESALSTIFNIPVIAEIIEKKDEDKDFGTHGGRIIIDSNGIQYIQTTVPYGVVPESCNPRWETINEKEYLAVDVILWAGRYEDLSILLEDGSRPQSMEINVSDGKIENGKYQINAFEFSALTILGSNVEPCFEDAKVEVFNKDAFKFEYKEMLDKYQKYIEEKLGGDNVAKIEEKGEEFAEEKVEEEGADTDTGSTPEEGQEEVEVEEDMGCDDKEKMTAEFGLTMREKLSMIQEGIEDERVSDNEGNTKSYTSYWVMDADESYAYINVYFWDTTGKSEDYIVRAKYSINEESRSAMIDKGTFERMVMKLLTEEEANAVEAQRNSEFANLNEQITNLTAELAELKEFKNQYENDLKEVEIDEVLNEFVEDLKDNEEFKSLQEVAKDMEVEEVREKCYAIVGKSKHVSKTTKPNKGQLYAKVGFNKNNVEHSTKYGEAEKYFTKQ